MASGEPRRKKKRVALATPNHDTNHDPNYTSNLYSTLPEEAPISDEIFLTVIDTYFTYCQNQPYSFFHEGNFRRRLAEGSVPRHLILAVLASAIRFSSHPYFVGRTQDTSVEYANWSWKSVVSNCFTAGAAADIQIVQTIALLALFDFTGGWLPLFGTHSNQFLQLENPATVRHG